MPRRSSSSKTAQHLRVAANGISAIILPTWFRFAFLCFITGGDFDTGQKSIKRAEILKMYMLFCFVPSKC
ncbi:MAG: hypothetical protein JW745_05240 [Sedimentisphaerales bacterium]|nr:hypothetical protein [Sedimentisphaerales bacterium]